MTKRTQEMAAILIDGISNGIPLRQLCRERDISKSEVYRWLEDDAEFQGRFARARVLGFDHIAEECLEIADDATNDWMDKRNVEGEVVGQQLDSEHVQRSKLRIETRLKLLAKWDPKRYGERTTLAGDPEAPLLGARPLRDVSTEALTEGLRKLGVTP